MDRVEKIITTLKREWRKWNSPVVKLMARSKGSPFRVLVSALLSSRTRDETTARAVERLFSVADTPEKLSKLSPREIESLIYPVGFYRKKARTLKELSEKILKDYGGKVPDTFEELLKLPGVGRKTASLVLIRAFGKREICVDTHVHRIANRMGLVETSNPRETERALKERIPEKYWKDINVLFVALGQSICRPVSPLCSICPVESLCMKKGVKEG